MKIIGSAGRETYLAEVTQGEAARIIGKRYQDMYSLPAGTVLEVNQAYDRLQKLQLMRSDLDTARKKLRGLLKAIEPLEELILQATGETDE